MARAGRTGTAYSFVSPDEIPFLVDLHLFLGRSLHVAGSVDAAAIDDGIFGAVPQRMLDDETEKVTTTPQPPNPTLTQPQPPNPTPLSPESNQL